MTRLILAATAGLLILSPSSWGRSEVRPDKPSISEDRAAEGLRVVPRPRPGYFTVNISTDDTTYRIGESVRVRFRASRDAYVYIYSTSPSGQSRQIFPNYWDRDNFVEGGVTYSIPDSSYDLVAEGPGGRETLSIVAVQGHYRVPERYRTFSRSDPFPSAPQGKADIQAVVPRERRDELTAEDSTSIYIQGRRHWERPRPLDDGPRYLW